MVLTIKKLLDVKGLNSPYHGGLSSYSIVLMVSTFLKTHGIVDTHSAAKNLYEFLKFYGSHFNPSEFHINKE
jgi:non-canonical poly(A) RNA polymerase PAPD5/7